MTSIPKQDLLLYSDLRSYHMRLHTFLTRNPLFIANVITFLRILLIDMDDIPIWLYLIARYHIKSVFGDQQYRVPHAEDIDDGAVEVEVDLLMDIEKFLELGIEVQILTLLIVFLLLCRIYQSIQSSRKFQFLVSQSDLLPKVLTLLVSISLPKPLRIIFFDSHASFTNSSIFL